MEVAELLARIRRHPLYAGQLAHVEVLAARAGQYAEPDSPLPEELRRLLACVGIEGLYVHQTQALTLARARAIGWSSRVRPAARRSATTCPF